MASDSPQANGTSGSLRAAAAAGPNVDEVVFGSLPIKPWYPSFYPEELVGRRVDRLYVCQWCFKYTKELTGFIKHLVSTRSSSSSSSSQSLPMYTHTCARANQAGPARLSTAQRRAAGDANLRKGQLLAVRD